MDRGSAGGLKVCSRCAKYTRDANAQATGGILMGQERGV
jgi:hypothetical protein